MQQQQLRGTSAAIAMGRVMVAVVVKAVVVVVVVVLAVVVGGGGGGGGGGRGARAVAGQLAAGEVGQGRRRGRGRSRDCCVKEQWPRTGRVARTLSSKLSAVETNRCSDYSIQALA